MNRVAETLSCMCVCRVSVGSVSQSGAPRSQGKCSLILADVWSLPVRLVQESCHGLSCLFLIQLFFVCLVISSFMPFARFSVGLLLFKK